MGAEDSYREGVAHAERFRFEEARRALEQAVAQGTGVDALAVLCAVRGELGDSAGAEDALARAVALRPTDPSLALLDATLLPMVYRDAQDLERWRARYTSRLDPFVRDVDRYKPEAARILGLPRTNFLLAYQGRDDVALQTRLCKGLTVLLREACPQFLVSRKRVARSRIRVGFASAFLFDCTIGRYFVSWFEGLDTQRFEIGGFMTGTAEDDFTERIARSCAFFERVNLPVTDVAARIAAAELDVLVYPEIGMDPRCRLLSCLRLAPAQLAAWGHPQTTGSPEIDAYLTCAEMEAPQGQAHYTEPLLALPGLGVAYDPPPVPPPFARAELGLEPGRRVYCCPHSLFKLHPDTDALFAEILAADPDGLLVIFHAQSAGAEPARVIAERIARSLEQRGVAPRRQLRVVPRMAPTDFRRALQAADVVVDPLHWSGGNTALDALAMGVPVVTTPGELMRSRQAGAMLRRLGVAGLVAGSVEEAARIAVNVASDRSLRDAMAERIRANRGQLFGDREPVKRLASLLEELAARK